MKNSLCCFAGTARKWTKKYNERAERLFLLIVPILWRSHCLCRRRWLSSLDKDKLWVTLCGAFSENDRARSDRRFSLRRPVSYCFVFRLVLFLFSSSCFFVVQFGIFQSSGTNGKKSGNFYIVLIWTRRCQNVYFVEYFISNKCLDHTIQEMGTTSRVDGSKSVFCVLSSNYIFYIHISSRSRRLSVLFPISWNLEYFAA